MSTCACRQEWRPWLRLDPLCVGGVWSHAVRQLELVGFSCGNPAVEVRHELRGAFVVAGLGDEPNVREIQAAAEVRQEASAWLNDPTD